MKQGFLPLPDELIVDNFAGGGGASEWIRKALGREVDIAINHDEAAIAMHMANHPDTTHFHEDVFSVDPLEITKHQPVGLAWFSPDCTFHSKARGGKPFRDKNMAKRRRGLANIVVKWGRQGNENGRADTVMRLLEEKDNGVTKTFVCFGTNNDGSPRFPRALRKDIKLVPYKHKFQDAA